VQKRRDRVLEIYWPGGGSEFAEGRHRDEGVGNGGVNFMDGVWVEDRKDFQSVLDWEAFLQQVYIIVPEKYWSYPVRCQPVWDIRAEKKGGL